MCVWVITRTALSTDIGMYYLVVSESVKCVLHSITYSMCDTKHIHMHIKEYEGTICARYSHFSCNTLLLDFNS